MTRIVAQITPRNGHLDINSVDPQLRGRPNASDKTTDPVTTTDTGGCKRCADDVTDLA